MVANLAYITQHQTAVERDNCLPPGHVQENIAQTYTYPELITISHIDIIIGLTN